MRNLILGFAVALAAAAQQRPLAFTQQIWEDATPIYRETLAHPFLTGLSDGTLPKERFKFYMRQDARYLTQFGKALSALAAKAPDERTTIFLNEGALATIRTERLLHETFFTKAEFDATEMSPTNVAYTNHLLATVTRGSYAEGLAAVLPCYWIYAEVGKELKKRGSKDEGYARWINQYGSDAFDQKVREIIAMMDAAAAQATPEERRRIREIFLRSVRYEYLFWDMAWREERWRP